jgi:hypothetical protein
MACPSRKVRTPANGSIHQIETCSYWATAVRVRLATTIVEAIAITINGIVISGRIDVTHSASRCRKNAAVYGGGRAASFSSSGPPGPQIPTTHRTSPVTIPDPADSSRGPSERIAEPSRSRLVRRCVPQTASRDTPNSTQVVGCVNAAAIPIRKTADRAPQDVRAASANATIRLSRNRTVMLSR